MKGSIFLMGCFVLGLPLRAALITYPGPPGIRPSDQYAVRVRQDGVAKDPFVYLVHAQKPDSNRSKTTSWTTFSFSGPVTVEVTKLQGTFSTCKILPSSCGIQPRIRGNTVSFDLDRPRKVCVEFDGGITHPMLVFADPPETNVPRPGDPDVLYFGPGVHKVGTDFDVGAKKTVYLAGGAYVKGKFVAQNTKNLTIRGRGILSGEDFEKGGSHLLELKGWGTENALIEGITLVNSPHYNLLAAGLRNTVRNVKMISWHFSTDGVGLGRDGRVEDCFLKVNDDAIKLYHANLVVQNCVIWQLENGAPFQISWNMPSDNSGFVVRNCDVIRAEHRWDNANCAIFDAIHGGRGHMSGYLFDDIRVENASWRLLYLSIEPNRFADSAKGFGKISDLTFRNITVSGKLQKPGTIKGIGPANRIERVTFENLRIDGEYVRSAAEANIEIDPTTTRDIRFVVRP